jgi:hypothetical protein
VLQLIFKAFPNPFDYVGYPIAQLSNEMWELLISGGAAAEVVIAPATGQAPEINDDFWRLVLEQRRAQWNEEVDGPLDSDATMEYEDDQQITACSPAPTEPNSPDDARAYVMRARQAQLQAEERARQAEERARQAEERARQAEERARQAEAARTCVICLVEEKCFKLNPCDHVCVCQECVESLRRPSSRCPLCRKKITRVDRVFI